jgi:hypothetical protein
MKPKDLKRESYEIGGGMDTLVAAQGMKVWRYRGIKV